MRCARVLQRNNKLEIDRQSGRKEREISLSVDFSSYGYAQCLGEGNGNPVQYSYIDMTPMTLFLVIQLPIASFKLCLLIFVSSFHFNLLYHFKHTYSVVSLRYSFHFCFLLSCVNICHLSFVLVCSLRCITFVITVVHFQWELLFWWSSMCFVSRTVPLNRFLLCFCLGTQLCVNKKFCCCYVYVWSTQPGNGTYKLALYQVVTGKSPQRGTSWPSSSVFFQSCHGMPLVSSSPYSQDALVLLGYSGVCEAPHNIL